jgi:hypothetical protein
MRPSRGVLTLRSRRASLRPSRSRSPPPAALPKLGHRVRTVAAGARATSALRVVKAFALETRAGELALCALILVRGRSTRSSYAQRPNVVQLSPSTLSAHASAPAPPPGAPPHSALAMPITRILCHRGSPRLNTGPDALGLALHGRRAGDSDARIRIAILFNLSS